jgi:oligopeptidase B
LHVVDLETGAALPDTASNVSASLVWANDNRTLFYVAKEETTLRADRVFRHVLGGGDQLVLREPDGAYDVSVGNTKSHRFIEIVLGSTTMDEVQLIDADHPASAPEVFLPRRQGQLYEVEHLDGRFLIRTNRDAENFRLVEVREGKERDPRQWKDVIAHRPDALIEDFVAFRGFIAATVRTGGLSKVEVVAGKQPPYFLEASDPAFTMDVLDTPDPNARTLRYSYESMTTPESTYEVDALGKQRTLLKQQPVPTYDPGRYASEYVHAVAPDGAQVPVSIVYAKSTPRDGSAPLLIYGYGSYGSSVDPHFQSSVISLLDRGWVYAIAHVRGGEELGRGWYEDGKLMHKRNTFTDFIAVTEFLVGQRYGAQDRVFASGGSAGGLLIGAVLNLRPDLYRGALAIVPFVDLVTTMLDESIPLTTNEFDEWGNPKEEAAYRYMLSYSPYDNVKPHPYPALYVRTGLWDSQVQYYEPAKWVAKLRANKTDRNLLVMDVDMTSGHGGASGRFDRLRQTARSHSFLLLVNDRPDPRARPLLQGQAGG